MKTKKNKIYIMNYGTPGFGRFTDNNWRKLHGFPMMRWKYWIEEILKDL